MRPIHLIAAACAALTCAAPASASLPEEGFLVFKDSRLVSVTEVRSKGTGQVIATVDGGSAASGASGPCADPTFAFEGPRWKDFESYHVNGSSTPAHVTRKDAVADIVGGHEAWESPYVTDCRQATKTSYKAKYGGQTKKSASLVANLTADGTNVASFQSLAGTVCDGATACVVIDYKGGRIREADLALEEDLTRYGFQDFWTTGDRTWWDDAGGRWAISDVATHEWGHFAGLGHVDSSPTLTMYPYVHDGAQTLGLGDMLGIAARYPAKRD